MSISISDAIKKFKNARKIARKLALSVTVEKPRVANIQDKLTEAYPGFYFLNDSEKVDFMFHLLEGLMVASCQYGDFQTLEQKAAALLVPKPDDSLQENAAS